MFLKKIFRPPVFDEDAKTHQAYLLYIILWAMIFVPLPYVLYAAFKAPQDSARAFIQAASGEAVNIFLLYLLCRGYVRTAAIAQVSALWLFFTITSMTGLGVHGEGYLLGYPLVIMIAGILTNGCMALGVTILSLISGAFMVYAEEHGILILSHSSDPATAWVLSLAIFPMGMVLQYLSNRTVRDVLKRASTSEERYRLISRVTTDYTFASEVNKCGEVSLTWVAGAFETLTGYTYEEYVATGGWAGHIHPDDVEKDARDMEMLRQNMDVKSEIRTFAKNGEIRWERIFAHPVWDVKENRLAGIVGAVQDVTSSKIAEEKLKETLLQQSAILNGIPDMAWLKDKDGRYIAVNEQFIKAAGLKIEEIVGRSDFDIWHKDFANNYRLNDLEIMRTGQRMYIEEPQLDSAGREYWVETTKTPIRNAEGDVVGTTGIAREITERKKAEAEREALITELEKKNAELEQFTYTVSHDLKSPLVTIIGFLAYLEGDARKGNFDRLKQDIARIEQAVNKMQILLKDLLELSRIGRLMNPPVKVLFTDIVNEALELVHGQLDARKVRIELQDIQGVSISGDHMRLVEAFQNLLDNAAKFMGNQPAPMITIGSTKDGRNERIFYVQDNGIGIASEYHERIFGLFNKLNSSTEGTGIGLTLVKRIIEVHGGRIWLESRPAEGATFYFTLP